MEIPARTAVFYR